MESKWVENVACIPDVTNLRKIFSVEILMEEAT